MVISTAAVLAAVAALARGAHPVRFVGIDGLGGAGKSTLARRLAARVPAAVVSVDDFSGPHLAEWDWQRCVDELVAPLLAGRTASYRPWPWDAATPQEPVELPAAAVVVIEGVSATRAEFAVPWSLRIWVDAPQQIRVQRLVDRDGAERMAAVWQRAWLPSEQAYLRAQRPVQRAELIVAG